MAELYRWIEETEALTGMVEEIGTGPLSVDLEADSFHHYEEKICLLQFSFAGGNYLVDPLAGLDTSVLEPVLSSSGVRKILHGADYDLRVLQRDLEISLTGLFDTMIAARLVGEKRFGLADLLDSLLGVRLDKKFQRADWSRRPLSEPMKVYAVADTCHLSPLRDILAARLESLGRTAWAEEEFRLLEAVRWTGGAPDPDAYARIKGARKLDVRGLTVLREIHRHRERMARRRNVPPFKVLPEPVMLELAMHAPAAEKELSGIQGLPRAFRAGRGALALLGAVEKGTRAPLVSPPRQPARGGRGRAPVRGSRAAALRRFRDALARDLDVEPSLLLSRRVLEEILMRVDLGEDWRGTEGLREWQSRLLEPALEAL